MTRIGFQASHEQFSPADLLELAQLAERSGFQFILSSDHISPWSHSQDNSGFAWSWLGAALQATRLPYGAVTVPGYRYHPAVLAQAIATLCAMFPGRFTPCLGSGEALNEHIVGTRWPQKDTRNAILLESVQLMRQLWAGETVSHEGNIVMEEAKLYTVPPKQPTIFGAALSEQTAGWLGSWADGFITISGDLASLKKRVEAFRKSGGTGKPMILKAQLSYGDTHDTALDGAAKQWSAALMPPPIAGELKLTSQFDAAARLVSREQVRQKVKILTRPEDCLEWLRQFTELGFETIVLHNVNRNQEQFVKDFGPVVAAYFSEGSNL